MADKDLGKIKRNVGRMIDAGAPEADIDAYLGFEGVTVDTLRASSKPRPLGKMDDFTDALIRSATFGLSDKVGAAGSALGAKAGDYGATAINELAQFFTGGRPFELDPNRPSFGEVYQERLGETDAAAREFARTEPVAEGVATGLGMVGGIAPKGALGAAVAGAPARAAARPGILRQIAEGATAGGAIGAGAGYGYSREDSPFLDMLTGGAAGAAFGAATPIVIDFLINPALRQAGRIGIGPRTPEALAAGRLGKAITEDIKGGGPPAKDMVAGVREGSPGQALVDEAGENVRALAGQVFRTKGPARARTRQILKERDKQAGSVMLDDVSNMISSGGDAYTAMQNIAKTRAGRAKPLYDSAMAVKDVTSDRLKEFIRDPDMIAGMKKAYAIERRNALAEGRSFNANDFSIHIDPPGTPQEEAIRFFIPSEGIWIDKTPNMRTLDLIKRNIDDRLEAYRDPITRRLNLDAEGRSLEKVRAAFVDELDAINPAYKAARAAWAGPSAVMTAIDRGKDFQRMAPAQLKAEIAKLTPSEKEGFLLGAAETLSTQIKKTSSGGNEARRIVGNQHIQELLEPLFSNKADYQQYIARATGLDKQFSTMQEVMGGSQTAARVAQDAGAGADAAVPLAMGGAALAYGEPVYGAALTMRGLANLKGLMERMSPPEAEALVAMLYAKQPDVVEALIQSAIGQHGRPRLAGPVAGALAGQAPRLTSLADYSMR